MAATLPYFQGVNRTTLLVLLTVCLHLVPDVAYAVTAPETELLPMGLKVMSALVIVLALVLLIYAGLKKSGRWIRTGKESSIQLLEVRYLAPKKALYLIEVNGEKLLLSGTAGGLEKLAHWPLLPEEGGAASEDAPCFESHLQQVKEQGPL